ncbi:MAG: TfoX/Sxy family protein [Actinomycetota bacterium]|nr:TfoX/Sxy family protein [Actinomycetota bacterium]
MPMEKPSAALVARYEELAEVVPQADRKLVFGSPCCLAGGNMFFGVHAVGIFVKLPPEQGQELLSDGGAPFEPMPGRAMGGFYVLPDGEVADWVRRSYDYVRSLPAKEPKKAAR